MRDNALYFPYISVPKSDWITHVLLYWDKLRSLVPYEYISNPDLLSPEMRDLVSAELVEQVIPGQYVHEIPNFENSFSGHIEQWVKERNGDLGQEFSRIHAEKLGSLEQVGEREPGSINGTFIGMKSPNTALNPLPKVLAHFGQRVSLALWQKDEQVFSVSQ